MNMKATRIYTLLALLLMVPDPPFERGNRLVLISFFKEKRRKRKATIEIVNQSRIESLKLNLS